MRGLTLCAAVAACATVSDSLVLLILLPVQLLLCLLFAKGLRRLNLSVHTAVWLFAGGSGTALLHLAALTPYAPEQELPAFIALLLCGAVTPALLSSPPPPNVLWRVSAVMLLIGFFRELLAHGSVFSLAAISPPAVTTEPIGALLLAALLLWLFRLPIPVTATNDHTLWNTVWLTLAVCSVKALSAAFLPSLSDSLVMGLTLLTAALLSQAEPLRTAWAPLTPIVALAVSDGWWHALVAAAGTALVLLSVGALAERWRRVPLARSFAGAPAALTVIAVTLSAISSF